MEKGNKKVTEKKKQYKGEKFNIKKYLRDFLIFVDKNLIKSTGILIVVSILIIAISIGPMISSANLTECEGTCRDGIKLMSEYSSKLQVLLVTLIAGLVPYIYISIVGLIGYILNELYNLAFIIKGYGYLAGLGLGIIPLILNILSICIITSLAIYVCRTVTVGYKISSLKNMNFTNFRIKLYEVLQMEDKAKKLTAKKENKLNKLQNKKEKLKYLQILSVVVVVCIMQFISVLIQQILI